MVRLFSMVHGPRHIGQRCTAHSADKRGLSTFRIVAISNRLQYHRLSTSVLVSAGCQYANHRSSDQSPLGRLWLF